MLISKTIIEYGEIFDEVKRPIILSENSHIPYW